MKLRFVVTPDVRFQIISPLTSGQNIILWKEHPCVLGARGMVVVIHLVYEIVNPKVAWNHVKMRRPLLYYEASSFPASFKIVGQEADCTF